MAVRSGCCQVDCLVLSFVVDIWDLPGPAEYVDGIEAAIRDGANVIARFPLSPPRGLLHVLRTRLRSFFNWTTLDAQHANHDLVGFLCNEVCPQIRASQVNGIAELAALPDFQGRLLWIENIQASSWNNWSRLLYAYSDVCRNIDLTNRSSFVVVLNGELVVSPITDEVALVCHDFRSTVNELDLFILALHRIPRNQFPGHHRALLAHTVASIAKWDIALAERMLRAPSKELLDPDTLLEEYATERGWTPATPRCWESGTADGTDGQDAHSAHLQICKETQRIRQRLWAAQAAVLLPIVEERRIRFVKEHGHHHLCLPAETDQGLIEDPLSLSIGQLVRQLNDRGVPNHITKHLRLLRRLRNALAHMKPVSANDAWHRSLYVTS